MAKPQFASEALMLAGKYVASLFFCACLCLFYARHVRSQPIPLSCSFKNYAEASDCKEKVLPNLHFLVDDYSVRLATLRVEVSVTYQRQGVPIPVPKVQGTAFLVNRDLGFFLTSKHVLLGDKVWDLDELGVSNFVD